MDGIILSNHTPQEKGPLIKSDFLLGAQSTKNCSIRGMKMALPSEKTPNNVKDSSALEKATLMGKYDTHLENISVLQNNYELFF